MNISKTLELSTANLSEEDCLGLSSPTCKSIVKGEDEYSVLVVVSDWHYNEFKNISSLEPIMKYAFENDIRYLNFDRDNEPCEKFEQFDW